MFTLKVENSKGAILELTDNEENYQITKISGLNPPNANINTSNYANSDGFSFDSSRIPNRQVVITVYINGDVEKNRLTLYKYFRNKEWCKIYYESESRNVYIEGYVQTLEVSPFDMKQIAQISILCPNPYFKDLEKVCAFSSICLLFFRTNFYPKDSRDFYIHLKNSVLFSQR